MKKLLSIVILMLIVSVSFAQFGGIGRTTVSKVVGLQDSLNTKMSQTQADLRYPQIADSVLGYTAAEVDSIVIAKAKEIAYGTTIFNSQIAHWKFDESSGALAYTQGGYTGTKTSIVNNSTGHLNRSVGFDAATDNINVTNVLGIRPQGNDFTISLWYKLSTLVSTTGRTVYLINARHNSLTAAYQINIDTNNRVTFFCRNTGGTSSTATSATNSIAADGVWHHLCCVLEASTGLPKIYLDGVSIGTNTPVAFTGTLLQQDRDLVIGNTSNSASNAWIGDIDEVRILEDGLTSTQVIELYSAY